VETGDIAKAKPSKSEKKKANKKLKADSGAAVPTQTETTAAPKEAAEGNKDVIKEKKEVKKKGKEERTSDSKDSAQAQGKGGLRELPGGMKLTDVKVGTGPQAKKGNTVLMRYIGKLQDGKVFDSNTKGKPVCCIFQHEPF